MKHKKTILTLIALGLFHIAAPILAQTYTVVRAQGKVTLQSNKKTLRHADKFKAAPLQFSDIRDFLVVLDEKEEAFVLYPEATLKKHQTKHLPPTGARPGLILSDLQLRTFLDDNDSLLLLNGQYSLLLGRDAFPMDDQHFFYLQYVWRGDTINKKLSFRQDTLLIQAAELYKVDGNPIDPMEVSERHYLFYLNTRTQKSVAYPPSGNPLYILRPDDEAIQKEMNMILQPHQDKPFHLRLQAATTYLREIYGTPGDAEVEHLIKTLQK